MTESANELRRAIALQRSGDFSDAEAIYRRVISDEPENADALHLLGALCSRTGRVAEARALLSRAIQADPSVPQFHNNLGSLLGRMERPAEAAVHLRQAIRLRPDYAEAHLNLGIALEQVGQVDHAEAAFRQAAQLKPKWPQARRSLGTLLRTLGRGDEAETELRAAIAAAPDDIENYSQLAAVYASQGRIEETTNCYRDAAARHPNAAAPHSDLLHLLHYDPALTAEALLCEAKQWAQKHAEPLRGEVQPPGNDRSPDRRLRIGFVSADLREHPVARLMLPILRFLDRSRFEIFCYSDVAKPEETTSELRKLSDGWRETANLTDAALANLVRQDGIDVLVDLGGHMGGNRLLTFARKPAPVQFTHFNYPDTTGMTAMDWRITDELSEPTGSGADRFSTERLMRLPHCAWCYDPGDPTPPVGPLPATANVFVTFGCLNKPLKVTRPAVALWSRILRSVENSRLMLLTGDRESRHVRSRFADHGIDDRRLTFVGLRPRYAFLELFKQIDIALDPFPYNGGVTTCDGLWMGVPHVTLAGNSYMARQGLMLLTNLGLDDLIARDMEDYHQLAVSLAADLSRLTALRSEMRSRLAKSSLMDCEGFARDLGAAFRQIWKH